MIGILLITQGDIGKALIQAAKHMLDNEPPQLKAFTVNSSEPPEQLAETFQQELNNLDQGQGVLILADIYGASHTNAARRVLKKDHIEMITGVNLPMLIRVLNYRNLGLAELIDKALAGGSGGIVCAISMSATTRARR